MVYGTIIAERTRDRIPHESHFICLEFIYPQLWLITPNSICPTPIFHPTPSSPSSWGTLRPLRKQPTRKTCHVDSWAAQDHSKIKVILSHGAAMFDTSFVRSESKKIERKFSRRKECWGQKLKLHWFYGWARGKLLRQSCLWQRKFIVRHYVLIE